jgi:hypothetical protein
MDSISLRKECIAMVGFVDPGVVHEATVRDKPEDTMENLYKALLEQRHYKHILLPYNFQ